MLEAVTIYVFFFFNDTATTEIYTLSLHDALPIFISSPAASWCRSCSACRRSGRCCCKRWWRRTCSWPARSEEHTSELQSQSNLVCRLLLEKKKKNLTLMFQIPTAPPANTNCNTHS